ncbi:MAG: hypothetical protein KKE93_00495 [Nanoarchaeota archaeon]|nr:hypothetical protein [Nanoarchaeota archaeon]
MVRGIVSEGYLNVVYHGLNNDYFPKIYSSIFDMPFDEISFDLNDMKNQKKILDFIKGDNQDKILKFLKKRKKIPALNLDEIMALSIQLDFIRSNREIYLGNLNEQSLYSAISKTWGMNIPEKSYNCFQLINSSKSKNSHDYEDKKIILNPFRNRNLKDRLEFVESNNTGIKDSFIQSIKPRSHLYYRPHENDAKREVAKIISDIYK